jgi:RimJ/RimL family protein N-acetyltransferase
MAMRFRDFGRDDLPRMHEWLQRPHVRRWWNERETLEEVEAHYLPAIEGTKPTRLYVAELDGEPFAFVQSYLVNDHPDFAALVGVEDDVAGMDLFIADEANTGRGLGTELIRRFVSDVVFARAETVACIADPEVRNAASRRAFEKAGFRVVREFVLPEDEKTYALVRFDRD